MRRASVGVLFLGVSVFVGTLFFPAVAAADSFTQRPSGIQETLPLYSFEQWPAETLAAFSAANKAAHYALLPNIERLELTTDMRHSPAGRALAIHLLTGDQFTLPAAGANSLFGHGDLTGFDGLSFWLDNTSASGGRIQLQLGGADEKGSLLWSVQSSEIVLPAMFKGYFYLPFSAFTAQTGTPDFTCVNRLSLSSLWLAQSGGVFYTADWSLYRTGSLCTDQLIAVQTAARNGQASLDQTVWTAQSITAYNTLINVLLNTEMPDLQGTINTLAAKLRSASDMLTPIDYVALLSELVHTCHQLQSGDYTEQSFTAMMALCHEETDPALAKIAHGKLLNARAALVPRPLYALSLKLLITQCEALDRSPYTGDTVILFEGALRHAQTIAATATSQAEIDGAEIALRAALLHLQPRSDQPSAMLVLAMTAAGGIDPYKYSVASYAVLKAEMDKGAALLSNPNSTAAVMDEAAVRIRAAIDALKPALVDKSLLHQAIVECESLNKGDYYATEWNVLQSLLKKARALLINDEATQLEVDRMWEALLDALAALRPKSPSKAAASKDSTRPDDASAEPAPALTPQAKEVMPPVVLHFSTGHTALDAVLLGLIAALVAAVLVVLIVRRRGR